MKATIETLKDALGNEVFRVSRIFPNSSSAHRGAISLDAINPEAFAAKPKPCGRKLAAGQYWAFCGETDMGQSLPYLCTECGGDLALDPSRSPFAKGEAFDPPEGNHIASGLAKPLHDMCRILESREAPPNCEGNNSVSIADSDSGKVTVGEYMAQLQADSAEGDLDPRAVQAGIEGAGT